ncbi:hypothetical protein [Schlesneria paludicola]|uniref:hypothetical protein n=1 Tax=Schlesneria paludicola TaxID=360056 RepID=UPI00029A2899|nr:hypothetical protein [Schlesneria paludicola]
MTVFTFHLAKTTIGTAIQALLRPPIGEKVRGLVRAECMTKMTLGAPILSPARMQLRHLTMFAAWESQVAIDEFLANTRLGRAFATGWHVRMAFQRRWGYVSEFDGLTDIAVEQDPTAPVVAVTLARMKLSQVPRFIRWGRPVEELVRDHPSTTLAIAALRLPRTVSTFSVWTSQQEMFDMVRGQSAVPYPARHAAAMAERQRKDFHFEFATLRFRPIAEYGNWEGRTQIIPT